MTLYVVFQVKRKVQIRREIKRAKRRSLFEDKPTVKRLQPVNQHSKMKNKKTQFPERNKKNAYSEQEKRLSIMLMFSSKKSYRLLRGAGIVSRLPHESTVRKWVQHFECRPGHNSHLMKLLSYKNLTFTEKKDNYCVLMFDGMHLKNETKYSQSLGELIEGANEVEVVLLRGLFKNWKHICQFDFDKKMDIEDLKKIIINIQETGLIVKALIMDLGNHHIQGQLNIAKMEYKFPNPSIPGEEVLIIPDPIHCLKNLRTALIDHGAVFDWRGKKTGLGREDFKAVIQEHSKPGKLDILYKVTIKTHIELSKQEKQRVDKAFQLLSRRMSNAFRLTGRVDQGDIIGVLNDFFDVLNSRSPFHYNPLKSAFGKNLELQMKAIEDMRELMMGMKINPSGKRARHAQMPFQKGILTGINSILHLKEELKLDQDNYLLLSKVRFYFHTIHYLN